MRKKLCIDARHLNNSGLGRYLEGILKYLFKENKYEISLLIDDEKKLFNKNCESIKFDAGIYSVKEQFLFPLKIPKCDLFWSPHYNIPILPIKAKRRLVTIHDIYHLRFIEELSFFKKLYAKYVIKKALEKSDQVITVSNFSKREILSFFPKYKEKIQAIHLGIDLDFFSSSNFSEIEVERKDLPSNYFLFVGNLKKHKNLKRLIKVFEKFSKKYKDNHLVLIGKYSDEDRVKDQLNSSSNITIINDVLDKELPFFYAKAKALIFPSYYEGFGIPPIEAMALNVPVLASTAASIPEVCKDAAIFFDPFDEPNIFDALESFENEKSLKNILISKGKEVIKDYSIEKSGQKHSKLIEEMMR